MKRNRSTSLGFTIVELLIVIVVIAILAAITVVAYSGIQEKARETKTITMIDSYTKILELNKVTYNEYPYTNSDGTYCLGSLSDYPAENGFEEGECIFWGEDEDWRRSHKVADEDEYYYEMLAEFASSIPSAATQVVTTGDEHYRGPAYHSFGTVTHIHYFLQGNKTCPKGDTYVLDDITECIVSLGPPDEYTDEGEHGGEG